MYISYITIITIHTYIGVFPLVGGLLETNTIHISTVVVTFASWLSVL